MITTALVIAPAMLLLTLAIECWRWGITPTPSTGEARRRCLEFMREQNPTGTVVDLGSGTGGMARAMAQQLPLADIRAVEGSVLPLCVARARSCFGPRSRVRWQRGDLFAVDLRGCSGVFCYLYPGAMARLSEKLRGELPAGAWVVSHAFALPNWSAERVVRCSDFWRTPIYLYRNVVSAEASPSASCANHGTTTAPK